MVDTTMTLPDGRTLAYTEIGAPGGPVALYFHGAPGSRLELVALDEAFAAVGVRVVTPDRPGYGGSTPRRGRTTADWADDVAALADHLGVERFAVMGLSSGGPYAVACASLLGDRVTGAIVAAGNTDMSWPQASDGYLQSELDIMAMDDEDTAAAWCTERYGADGSGFFGGGGDLHLGEGVQVTSIGVESFNGEDAEKVKFDAAAAAGAKHISAHFDVRTFQITAGTMKWRFRFARPASDASQRR